MLVAARATEERHDAAEKHERAVQYFGREIHKLLDDGSLPANFPVIDMLSRSGVITSIKSIDLNAAAYQKDMTLMYRLSDYVGRVSGFNGADFAGNTIKADEITGRVLQLVVPKGSMTNEQKIIIDAVRSWARTLSPSVDLIITEF